MMILQTTRLNLRPFTAADLDFLYQLHANPEVAKTTIDGVQSLETVKKHLDSFIAHQEKYGYSQWAIFDSQTSKFAGRAGFTTRALNQEIGQQTEIRFAIMPQFWGRGYACELTAALIKFAFEDLKLETLAAANGPTNEKSHRVLVKNGFEYIKNIIPQGYGTSDEIRYYTLSNHCV